MTACLSALQTVSTTQKAVTSAQQALAAASTALDQLLNQRASTPPATRPATGGFGGSSGGSGGSSGGSGGSSGGSGGSSGGSGSSSAGRSSGSAAPSAADLSADQAAVDAASANVVVAQQALAQATLTSPINGTVDAVNLVVGASVTAASSTANIVVQGSGGYQVSTTIGVDNIPHVAVGQPASVVPDGAHKPLSGKVAAISIAPNSTSALSTTYLVVIGLKNPNLKLGNGSTGTVTITTQHAKSTLAVPTSTVTTSGTSHTVEVLDGNTPRRTTVRVGVVGYTWTQITSGLKMGQQVVLAQLSRPLPGSATSSSTSTSSSSASTTLNGPTLRGPRRRSRAARRLIPLVPFQPLVRGITMNNQPASALRARTSVLERAVWAALPIVTLLSLVLAAGPADAQTSSTTPPPFTSGMLSGLTGSTLSVQARNGRAATVVVTSSTTYQQTKTATASDIAQGDCVRVVGTGSTTSGIQATTVVLTKPTSKGCTPRNPLGGNGSGSGARRFGNGTPGSTPFTLPNGSAGTVPANIAAAFGTVSSVSGDQLTVKEQAPKTTKKTKKTKAKTGTVAVTLTGSTTVTETVNGAVADLAVGSCVTANGTVDSLGTITAKSVTISQPQNGSCGGGFGGFGGFRGRVGSGAGAGGGTPTSSS